METERSNNLFHSLLWKVVRAKVLPRASHDAAVALVKRATDALRTVQIEDLLVVSQNCPASERGVVQVEIFRAVLAAKTAMLGEYGGHAAPIWKNTGRPTWVIDPRSFDEPEQTRSGPTSFENLVAAAEAEA